MFWNFSFSATCPCDKSTCCLGNVVNSKVPASFLNRNYTRKRPETKWQIWVLHPMSNRRKYPLSTEVHFSENSLWLHLQRAQHNLSCKFKAFPINKETNVKLTNKGVPFLLKKMLEIDLIFTIKPFFSRKIFWFCLFPNLIQLKKCLHVHALLQMVYQLVAKNNLRCCKGYHCIKCEQWLCF